MKLSNIVVVMLGLPIILAVALMSLAGVAAISLLRVIDPCS